MKISSNNVKLAIILLGALLLIFISTSSFAGTPGQLETGGILNKVHNAFVAAISQWRRAVSSAAEYLFFTLALISFVWTFGQLALQKADISQYFSELIRFLLFFGFFFWLLENGPKFAEQILSSFKQIGANAAGMNSSLDPSGIIDKGFEIYWKSIEETSLLSPAIALVKIGLGLSVLILLSIVAINIFLLSIAAWVLAYAGIILLGFGGSRWTSDMAISYYKAVLANAIQIFTATLIVGITFKVIDDTSKAVSTWDVESLAVIAVCVIVLFNLVNKLPGLLAGIVTGSSNGSAGIGQLGAGSVVAAAAMAATAATAAVKGATATAGAAKAVMAASSAGAEKARQARSTAQAMGIGASSSSTNSSAGTSSPFAQAAGIDSSSGSSTSSKSPSATPSSSAGAPAMESSNTGSQQSPSMGSSSFAESQPSNSASASGGFEGNEAPVASNENARNLNEAASTSEKSDTGQAKSKAEAAPAPKPPGFFAKSTTAQVATALAKGSWKVMNDSIDNTRGGKIAQAINKQREQSPISNQSQGAATFQKGNSISNPTAMDELKEFVNKKS
ncbi:MAG: P-type conjugative transfer protein TrbL [Limnobacter sp.]|jgi:type IV secretion system protein TrbL